MAIDTIIFDLGGVMIDWEPRRLYKKIFHSDHAVDFFLNNVTTSEWNEMQDSGRPIAEANALLISQFPEYTEEILAFYGQWEAEMLGGVIPGMLEVLKYFVEAKEFQKVVALTNWSAETFPIAVKKFDFLSWFDGILVSGAEKLKKPDLKIYHLLMERYQINPLSSLFIDDNLKNIEAAEKLGINAIHFTGKDQLIQKLDEFAIRIE
jgi:2-haloacid dehalogenase